jgi:hypothetical protein
MYPYTYPTEPYDEFGDKFDEAAAAAEGQPGEAAAGDAAAGGAAAAAGGAAAGQQQQEEPQQQLRDLGDSSYGGGWKDDMWEDEMFQQVRCAAAAAVNIGDHAFLQRTSTPCLHKLRMLLLQSHELISCCSERRCSMSSVSTHLPVSCS